MFTDVWFVKRINLNIGARDHARGCAAQSVATSHHGDGEKGPLSGIRCNRPGQEREAKEGLRPEVARMVAWLHGDGRCGSTLMAEVISIPTATSPSRQASTQLPFRRNCSHKAMREQSEHKEHVR